MLKCGGDGLVGLVSYLFLEIIEVVAFVVFLVLLLFEVVYTLAEIFKLKNK